MIRLRSLFTCVALAQAAPTAEQSELSAQNALGSILAYGAGAVVFVTLVVLALKLLAKRRGGRACTNADCGAENDARAKFCRRCGKALA